MARERGKARRVSPDRRKRAERSPATTQTPEEGESRQRQHSASAERSPASDRGVESPGQAQRREQIAVAAYYHAERRGFEGNRELDDWLEAEREIDSRTAGAGIQHVASALAEASQGAAATTDEDRKTPPGEELIEPDQLSTWAKKLKVPAPRLREAIQRVGPIVGDVKQYLEPSDDHA